MNGVYNTNGKYPLERQEGVSEGVSNNNSRSNKGVDKMGKDIIVAKMTVDGVLYVGKREIEMYDSNSKLSPTLIANANTGLVLATQRAIRDAVAIKNGIKKVTSGGTSRDLSSIESV